MEQYVRYLVSTKQQINFKSTENPSDLWTELHLDSEEKNATNLQLQCVPAFDQANMDLLSRQNCTCLPEVWSWPKIFVHHVYGFFPLISWCWKIFEQTCFIETSTNICGVWLQAYKQQKYLKNLLFFYWSKGVLEILLWQQFLPSGRSMPLSLHRNKTIEGLFQN